MSTTFIPAIDAAVTRAGFTEAERQEFRTAVCKQPGDLTEDERELLIRYEVARYEAAEGGP